MCRFWMLFCIMGVFDCMWYNGLFFIVCGVMGVFWALRVITRRFLDVVWPGGSFLRIT